MYTEQHYYKTGLREVRISRCCFLFNGISTEPRVSTPSGKHLQQSIIEKVQNQHLDLRGDNWIIQNDEVCDELILIYWLLIFAVG